MKVKTKDSRTSWEANAPEGWLPLLPGFVLREELILHGARGSDSHRVSDAHAQGCVYFKQTNSLETLHWDDAKARAMGEGLLVVSASVAHSLSYPEGPSGTIELYPTLPQYREVGVTVRSTVGHQDLSLCLHHACRFAGHLAGIQILISRFGLLPEILLPGKVLVHRPHFEDQGFSKPRLCCD